MSPTTAFIAELIRAANEVDKLTPFEFKRLLIDRSPPYATCASRPA